MSIDRWIDKEAVVHIHNGILLSHKKECIWVNSNEVDEPRACYTEWSKSEREKEISYTNVYIWNLERQYWWKLFAEDQWRHRCREQTYGHGGGQRGAGERRRWDAWREQHGNIHYPWKIDGQWEFAVWHRELKLGLCNNLEVGGRWEGTDVYLWLTHVDVWQKPTQYCKTIILQFKN